MAATINIDPPIYIKKDGIFDMDSIYSFLYSWYGDKGYLANENLYKHKPGFVRGNEIEIETKGFKKTTPYVRYWIEIKFHLWDAEDIEVLVEGKKKKLTKARMRIQFKMWMDLDWENRWEKSKAQEALREFYHKYIIKRKIEDDWIPKLAKETYEIHDKIKLMLDQEAAKWAKKEQ